MTACIHPRSVLCFQSGYVESTGTQVLVLGLDGAGKTSLLSCWATGSPEPDVKPTQGFNAVSINREDLHVNFLESESKPFFTPGTVDGKLSETLT